jgi:hypothetical protein
MEKHHVQKKEGPLRHFTESKFRDVRLRQLPIATCRRGVSSMKKENDNVIQFPVSPKRAKADQEPHPRNSCVYVREDSSTFFVNGKESAKFGEFTFVHVGSSGEAIQFGRFDTIEEAKHAGRAYADAFNIVFQS